MNDTLDNIDELREKFVRPTYLQLLHGNFMQPKVLGLSGRHEPDAAAIHAQIITTARQISDDEIRRLLTEREWRGRLVAGWLVGLSKRAAFVDQIAALLLASEQTYAGQGYCVALGLIGNEECRSHLCTYLTRYLPPRGRFYDQHWAIGALAHIEQAESKAYLLPELWIGAQPHMNPSNAIRRFSQVVDYLEQHQMIVTA